MNIRNILLQIPTTKLRIVLSLCIYCWIAHAVIVQDKVFGLDFYGFVLVMTGLDVTQYLNRKVIESVPVQQENSESTSDISEIQSEMKG